MKHIYRKPLLPLLLLAVFVFGICFMTFFQKGMAEDRQRIDDIYNNTHIWIEVLPAEEDGDVLAMNVHRGDLTTELPEVADSFVMMQCYYYASSLPAESNGAVLYGTNNPEAMASSKNFQIQWGDGWNRERFLQTETETACLMSDALAQEMELRIGDTFTISPTSVAGQMEDGAPERQLTLAGTLSGKQSNLERDDIIIPRSVFTGKDGLLFNYRLMYSCFYRAFRLEIDPAYNRNLDEVLLQVEDSLIDSYTLVSNARTMKQAIRPIEQKLQLQEMLRIPLQVVFCVAAAVVALLLSLSLKTEAFLRFLMGQGRTSVFIRLFGSVILVLVACTALTLALVCLTAGWSWLPTAGTQLLYTLGLALLAMGVPLAFICGKNLVKLYQEREG